MFAEVPNRPTSVTTQLIVFSCDLINFDIELIIIQHNANEQKNIKTDTYRSSNLYKIKNTLTIHFQHLKQTLKNIVRHYNNTVRQK